jgi:hypothetical protein
MLKRFAVMAVVLLSGALQACTPCTTAQKNACGNWCSTRTDCPGTPGVNTPGQTVGTVSKLGSCMAPDASLVMPAPYFVTRTGSPRTQNPYPKACQPFDVVWNVCNSGNVNSAAINYTVSLVEQIPPGGNPGLNQTVSISLPALAPCACNTQSFVSTTGLHCNEPTFAQAPVNISTSLNKLYTGTFTVTH